jgi:hypothetical protein
MALPTNNDLTQARRQRDSALSEAKSAQKMIKDALAQLGPAQKEAKKGWAQMKSTHKLLTAKRLFGKGRRRRALLALMLPEISKAYMLSYKRAPKAISVINGVTNRLRSTKKELDASVAALEAINIPSSTSALSPAALQSIPGQVTTAKSRALATVDKADKLLAKCNTYQRKSIPFLKATSNLLKKTERLAKKRIKRLQDRKLVLIAKKSRVKGYKKIASKTGNFKRKIDKATTRINAFVQGCPGERQKLSSVGQKIQAISLPGGSPNWVAYGRVPARAELATTVRANDGLITTLAIVGALATAAHLSARRDR